METNTLKTSSLVEQDQKHIWHPFTQVQKGRKPLPIVKGKGVYLYTEEGTSYIDAISSWWVNLHGHSHPYIAEKIYAQARELEHVLFAGFTHEPAVELAERLLSILPKGLSRIFYADNGATAVETALKMAIQYWYNKDSQTKRKKIVCFKQGYHGDTFGAMSVSSRTLFNRPFWSYQFEVEAIDAPLKGQEDFCIEQFRKIASQEDVACFIYEPELLGVGGMLIYPPEALNALLQICRDYQIITIADEVLTGFGRTGPLFASENSSLCPDIICLAKGLTGGFLPMGAVACAEFIFEAFLSPQLEKAFLHGHSYTANPIGCAAALASLDLLQTSACGEQREMIKISHSNFCSKIAGHPSLKRIEALGTVLIFEYAAGPASYYNALRDKLYDFFLDSGILLRPFGNTLHMIPPYCITKEELERIYNQIELSLETFP